MLTSGDERDKLWEGYGGSEEGLGVMRRRERRERRWRRRVGRIRQNKRKRMRMDMASDPDCRRVVFQCLILFVAKGIGGRLILGFKLRWDYRL